MKALNNFKFNNWCGGKFFQVSVVFLVIFGWIFSGWPRIWQKPAIPPKVQKAQASNYLTNPSFTGGTTGWTLTTTVYDSTYYQDTAGSVKTATAVGRNKTATGNAAQTISTNIEAGSTVKLSHYWSKQCVAINCALNTIQVDIAKPSAPTTWITIWSDTSIPNFGSPTAWTGPSNLDVSSNFNETGQYKFRVYANLTNGNNTSGQALAWFDNVNLDVTPPPPHITVGTTGTQIATTTIPSINFYVGGAFTFVRNVSSTTITQILINEKGSVNANLNLSNLKIRYETADTCTYNGDETYFNSTGVNFNSSDVATATGTMSVGTSQVCVYVILDVGSGASVNQTIEIEISNPSTDVSVTDGSVTPATAVQINGTTNLEITNLPPTVNLNTPENGSSTSDTTPTLNFTGTDPEADEVEYNVQINQDNFLFATGYEGNNPAYEEGTFYGTASISSSIVHSGSYSLRTNPTASYGRYGYDYNKELTQGVRYFRIYFYIATLPNIDSSIIDVWGGLGNDTVGIKLTTTGKLQLWNIEDNVQIGVDSSVLNIQTWYLIEMKYDDTTLSSTSIEAKLDGNSFASGIVNFNVIAEALEVGPSINVTADYYYDDVAISTLDWIGTNISLQKYSTLNTGFTVGHPYPSGTPTDYTVQTGDELALGTYYWRVRAVDPLGSNTYGAWSSTWSFTVTATSTYSVTVSDGVITYGILDVGTSTSTLASGLNDTQIVTNNGGATENLNIKGSTSTCWTLATSIGYNQYVHEFSTSSGSTWAPLTTSYQLLATSVPANATSTLDLRITAPNDTNCFDAQSVNVTVQAVAP